MDSKLKTKAPDSRDIEVGRLIRAQRLVRRMSQTELGTRVGITFQSCSVCGWPPAFVARGYGSVSVNVADAEPAGLPSLAEARRELTRMVGEQ